MPLPTRRSFKRLWRSSRDAHDQPIAGREAMLSRKGLWLLVMAIDGQLGDQRNPQSSDAGRLDGGKRLGWLGLQRIERPAVILEGEFDQTWPEFNPDMDRLVGVHGEAMADRV